MLKYESRMRIFTLYYSAEDAAMTILTRSPFKIVATLLVRNEADIIGDAIEHHVNQGVSQFIVTDNRSVDDTRVVVARYPEVVELIDERCEEHRQAEWVTRMARTACRLRPDWVVHLDGDELWSGLYALRAFRGPAVGCTTMFLHPPVDGPFSLKAMRHYLDFSKIAALPGECKVAHRPDPEVVVSHGNHACSLPTEYTAAVWRHHYPVRSYLQLVGKAVNGHEALLRRGAVCERWRKWYDAYLDGSLEVWYKVVCEAWRRMVLGPDWAPLEQMLDFWSTPEAVEIILKSGIMPAVGEWPICP